MKNTFSKYISGFILLLASAFLINVAVFQPVSAINYNDSSNRQQKLKMFLYAELVQACYAANYHVETDNARVDVGQLFYSDAFDAKPIVYAVNPTILSEVSGFGDDYWAGCGHDDGALTKAALKAWGIKATDLVCEMGYVRDGEGASCKQSTSLDYKSWGGIDGGQNRTNRFAAALNKLTGLDINNPGDDILYMKWASVVVDSCTTGNGLPPSEATVGSPLRYELKEVGETGSEITKVYSGGNKTTETPHTVPVSYTCGQALNRANGYIDTYISKTNEVAALKLCEQQGYRNIDGGSFPDQRDLAACVQGALHKDDSRYCLNNFPDIKYRGATVSKKSERDACAWGQGQNLDVGAVLAEEAVAADPSADETSSCVIEAIGWIICPTINFLSSVADSSFDFLADSFLRTDPQAFNTESSTYRAWQQIRNVANVVFVIGFIIIIFSQLTGMGVSNYGVKKTLPRLIIAAVLVNISFFITQIAIDLSNILGYSIRDVFDAMATSSGIGTAQNVTSSFATGEGFAGVAGMILTGAVGIAAIYALLSAFLPILLAAVIALAMILFILIARQALIILLVVLAPLAFVALLLPNTERFFKMWRKLLTAMLLLFPIIALIFGASLLASEILSNSFSGHVDGDGSNVFGQVVAAGVLVLPLFVVPFVLKKSLDAVPMLGGLANKWSSRANSNLGSKVKEGHRGSIVGRGRAIRKNAREAYKSRKFAERISKGGFMGTTNQVLASGVPVLPSERAANSQLKKSATAAMVRAQEEEIGDARKVLENMNLSGAQRQQLALGKTVTVDGQDGSEALKGKGLKGESMQRAAIQMQMGGAGSWGDIQSIVKASRITPDGDKREGPDLSKYRDSIAAQTGASGGKDPALTGKRIDQVSQGTFKYEDAVAQAIGEGKYTSEAFATMNDDARKEAIAIARSKAASGDPKLLTALQSAAHGIRSSTDISGRIAGNNTAEKQIAELLADAPASMQTVQPQAQAQTQAQGQAKMQAQAAAQSTPPPANIDTQGSLQIAHGAQDVHDAARDVYGSTQNESQTRAQAAQQAQSVQTPAASRRTPTFQGNQQTPLQSPNQPPAPAQSPTQPPNQTPPSPPAGQ